jgi:hypothetical protein
MPSFRRGRMVSPSCIQDVAINVPRGTESVAVPSHARSVSELVEQTFVPSRMRTPSLQEGIWGRVRNRNLMKKTWRYVQDYFVNV